MPHPHAASATHHPLNSSNHSGELKTTGGVPVMVVPAAPAAAIDAPMLSAMQQMFTTLDQQHQVTVAAPIYFN